MPAVPLHSRTWLRSLPALVWAGVIFAASSIPGSAVPGRLGMWAHFIEYAVLGALVLIALGDDGTPVRLAWIALAVCAAYAASDEFHQLFVPMRMCDPIDWTVDTLGAATGISAVTAARAWRRLPRAPRT